MKILLPWIAGLMGCLLSHEAASGRPDRREPVAPLVERVPAVSRAELDRHDLRWIRCDLRDCVDSQDAPAAPRVREEQVTIDLAQVAYLGWMHPNQSGAFTTPVVGNGSFTWIDSKRHHYRLRDRFYIATVNDEAVDQLDVYYVVRALRVLEVRFPEVYTKLFGETARVTTRPSLAATPWKNSIRSVFVSFDDSPTGGIAASITAIDTSPSASVYKNVALLSLSRETILGKSRSQGSRPLYELPEDEANYFAYMREGLIETLTHEMLHRYIDYANSFDARANDLYNRRNSGDPCQLRIEEILVASTSLGFFESSNAMEPRYFKYYRGVLETLRSGLGECGHRASWVSDLRARPRLTLQ